MRERKRTREFRARRNAVNAALVRFEQFAGTSTATQVVRAHLEALHFGPSTKMSRRAWAVAQEILRLAKVLDAELCDLVRFCETNVDS